jgi:hypothetical protein
LEKNAQRMNRKSESIREESRIRGNGIEEGFVLFSLVCRIRKSVLYIKFKKINEKTGEKKNGSGNKGKKE